LNWGLWL